MLTQVFFTPFSARGDAFWRTEIPKCLENGPFLDQRWVKNGSKKYFSKSDPAPLGVLRKVFSAHVEPVYDAFWPTENPSLDPKRMKNGSKRCFSKS